MAALSELTFAYLLLITSLLAVSNAAAPHNTGALELKELVDLLKSVSAQESYEKRADDKLDVEVVKNRKDPETKDTNKEYNYAECVFVKNSNLDPAIAGKNDIKGSVSMKQEKSGQGPVSIKVNVEGIDAESTAQHGFHVHQFGDLTNGCTSAGGHFNPAGKNHGAPTDSERHVGDWGNIERSDDGEVSATLEDKQASLAGGVNYIVGRSLVLHEKTDDLGKGGDVESLKTGNAGLRLACCVIGLAPDKDW